MQVRLLLLAMVDNNGGKFQVKGKESKVYMMWTLASILQCADLQTLVL